MSEKMYKILKEEIINCEIVPGTKITEENLVNRFHQSRTPVRGVIAKLATDGLLEVRPKNGTFVSKIDIDSIYDSMDIRIATEDRIYVDIIGKITDEQFKVLDEILDEQKKIIEMDSSIEKSRLFYDNDNRFHEEFFAIANKERLWAYLYECITPLNRARIMANLRENENVKEIYEAHLAMVEHLKNNDLPSLMKVFEKHLKCGFDGMESVCKKYTDYFK